MVPMIDFLGRNDFRNLKTKKSWKEIAFTEESAFAKEGGFAKESTFAAKESAFA
jgi:hypothetical protein